MENRHLSDIPEVKDEISHDGARLGKKIETGRLQADENTSK